MHVKLLGVLTIAAGLMATPVAADAACCDKNHKAHEAKACCADHHKAAEPDLLEKFMTMDPQLQPAPPVRQVAEVWFSRPTLIGRTIVQGRYVIEHDNDRMARGEPCTHLYAFNDQLEPVAAFHCTHLERDRAPNNIVVVTNDAATGMKRLTEFQFAGETASHGYSAVR